MSNEYGVCGIVEAEQQQQCMHIAHKPASDSTSLKETDWSANEKEAIVRCRDVN